MGSSRWSSRTSVRRIKIGVAAITVPILLAACHPKGPDYQRPPAPAAPSWETPQPWRPSSPSDAIPRGAWWTIFQDERLDALEQQGQSANQSLAAAIARFEQARALTAQVFASRFPTVSADPVVERQRLSGNRPSNGTPGVASTVSQFTVPITASYEVDLFGRRRRTLEGAEASLQSEAARLEGVRLVIASDIAANYFELAQIDEELDVLARTVQTLQRGLDLVRARRDGGIASGLDVAQEEALLASTQTQATLERRQRDELEHAIAQLTGQPAPAFHVAPAPLRPEPPRIDLGLPSDLLERRPDIAEAEREMASANADIGVAMSAYFPSINLFGAGGWQSTAIGSLLSAASTLWSVGASAVETIFNGGANAAGVRAAQAGYTATVASYRDTVLNAMREVEDAVSGLSVLNEARVSQDAAVDAARRALDIATSRYQGGLVTYLDVVSAQETLLNAERLAAQIRGEALVTSVSLVRALGGGWDAASLAAIRPGK